MTNNIRSPICTVVGHVDHGKSSILDKIRGTSIVASEPGAITQAIGASIIPLETIEKICGSLLENLKMKFTIPGLLFIDTPGHAAFTNLRKRGGSLADIAILVVDINEGFKPQTVEAIEILKQSKTPFIVAANKLDILPGWKPAGKLLIPTINEQSDATQKKLDHQLYTLVGKLSELGFNSERFDRVEDYTKQIAIVPTSALTGDGIPEMLMVLTGLAQRFLEKSLACDTSAIAKGTILEVKEEKGLGTTLDVILYDGCLKINEIIVIGGVDGPLVTKVKALFEPKPLAEMRDKKSKFVAVKQVFAATGVKISSPGLYGVVAGMPLRSSPPENIEQTKQDVQAEVKEVLIETDNEGIVIKADSLGSLEALIQLLKEKNIKIRKASVGNITKKDIYDAETNYDTDPLQAVVLGFNVSIDFKETGNVKVLTNNVIYKLIEDFGAWQLAEKKKRESDQLDILTRPCKLEILKGYVFRQSNPAVFGVSVLAGTLKAGVTLMKADGKLLSEVRSIQSDQENIEKAEKNQQVAIAMDKVTFGRHLNEGEILYSDVPEDDFRKLKELKKHLIQEEIELLKEIAAIKRKQNPVWGI
jgi:translation initiation factor 5B